MRALATPAIVMLCWIILPAQPISTSYNIVDLGIRVNTPYHEAAPRVSPDGSLLYFVVYDHPENTFVVGEDVWMSSKNLNGTWSSPTHLPAPFNIHHSNEVFTVMPDRSLLIRGGLAPESRGFTLVSPAGQQKELRINGFEEMDRGKYYGGSLAPDGKHLVMQMSEQDASIRNKLYISHLQADDSWSAPKRLAFSVDSDDFCPFFSPEGRYLYFASDRKDDNALGGADIYRVERMDDTFEKWSAPVNMGRDVNTALGDSYYSVDNTGNAFISRANDNVEEVNLDMYMLVPGSGQVTPGRVRITGSVYDFRTRQAIPAGVEVTIGRGHTRPQELNSTGGRFSATLDQPGKYLLTASSNGYLNVVDSVVIFDMGVAEVVKDIVMRPIEVGSTVRLHEIHFDPDSMTLRSESFPELDRVVTFLKRHPELVIEIAGHTDSIGNEDYNMYISQGRAQAVVDYVVERGVEPERLVAKGYGESMPDASNATRAGRALNRRVVFTVLRM